MVVVAVAESFLGDLVAAVLPQGGSLLALLGVTLTATVLANVVNNLPATLFLVPLVAPLGVVAVLATLIGLNAAAVDGPFHRLSALVTVPTAVSAAIVVLSL